MFFYVPPFFVFTKSFILVMATLGLSDTVLVWKVNAGDISMFLDKSAHYRSVKLSFTGPRKNTIRPEEIKAFLAENTDISGGRVEALWRTEQPDSWFVTFSTKEQSVKVGNLPVDNIGGTKVMCNVMQQQIVSVKVHWLPYGFRPSLLAKAFSKLGEVQDVDHVPYADTEGWGKVLTGTMIVRMSVTEEQRNNIPHLMEIGGKRLLLTMANRAPLCLKCFSLGHVRARCNAKFCSVCQDFGHFTNECESRPRKSYADRARGKPSQPGPVDQQSPPRSTVIDNLQQQFNEGAAKAKRVASDLDCSGGAVDEINIESSTAVNNTGDSELVIDMEEESAGLKRARSSDDELLSPEFPPNRPVKARQQPSSIPASTQEKSTLVGLVSGDSFGMEASPSFDSSPG